MTVPTSAPAQIVELPALLKTVSLFTLVQPEMSTITITESTTVVSPQHRVQFQPLNSLNTDNNLSTSQFSLSLSSVTPMFQLMALEPSFQRQSMTSSKTMQPTVWE